MKHSTEMYRKLLLLMMHSKRHMHAVIEKWQMTPVQGMMLMVLQEGQSKPMQELSIIMGCDASNVTGLVDRLESQGLIERTTDPQDRRVKMIKLSSKGCECRSAILEGLRSAEAADLQKLTEEETVTLARIIDKMLN